MRLKIVCEAKEATLVSSLLYDHLNKCSSDVLGKYSPVPAGLAGCGCPGPPPGSWKRRCSPELARCTLFSTASGSHHPHVVVGVTAYVVGVVGLCSGSSGIM